jgi:hypothetical protein
MRAALAARYWVVRPFLVLLAEALPLGTAPAGRKILAAVRALPDVAARRVRIRPLSRDEINADLMPLVWGRAVYGTVTCLPARWTGTPMCCVSWSSCALCWAAVASSPPPLRWVDPRAMLLDGPAREAVRAEITAGLGLAGPSEEHLRGPGPLAGCRLAGHGAAPRRGWIEGERADRAR